jgi:hypothetical protein
MSEDGVLLASLRTMWDDADPMPADLVDRIVFTLQISDLEVELMRLHEAMEPAGVRGIGAETAGTITFSSTSLTVMLTVTGDGAGLRRVDGWLAPAAALRVELRLDPCQGDHVRHTVADDDGRFSFDDAPAGLVQLRIHPTDDAVLALERPVVTPAVQI